MQGRWKAIIAGAAAIAAVACGHSEKGVVDQYFRAVQQQDTQTQSAFSVFSFDQKVEKWEIKGDSGENKSAAPLPDLIKAQQAAQKDLEAHNKEFSQYKLENAIDLNAYKEIRDKGGKVPAKLQPMADRVTQFAERDKEVKKKLAEAKEAVAREKAVMTKSVQSPDNLESLTGELIDKKLQVALTIGGQVQDYTMTLRKYQMKDAQRAIPGRWIILSLKPGA